MSPSAPPSIDVLDVLSPGIFAAAVSPLFEGAPRFLGRLAMARPFGTLDEFYAGARRIAHAMPVAEQLELIDAHPRLGAPPASMSALSFVEQGYDAGGRRPRGPRRRGRPRPRGRRARRAQPGLRGPLRVPLLRLRRRPVARRSCCRTSGPPSTADRDAEIRRAIDAVIDIARDRHARLTEGTGEAGR